MENWHRRLMRLMLPLGIAWFAYGVVDLIVATQSGHPHPAAVFAGIMAIAGGIIFVVNRWVYRHEVT